MACKWIYFLVSQTLVCPPHPLARHRDTTKQPKVVAQVEHNRGLIPARREGATKLLMEDDRGFRRANHHNRVDSFDMNRFVELVDAVQYLQRTTVIRLEVLER